MAGLINSKPTNIQADSPESATLQDKTFSSADNSLIADARARTVKAANPSTDWKSLAASLANIDTVPVEKFLAKNLPQLRRLDDLDSKGKPVVSDDEVARIKKEFVQALGLDKKGVDPKSVALAYGTSPEGILSVALIAKDPDGKGGMVANGDKPLYTAVQKLTPEATLKPAP